MAKWQELAPNKTHKAQITLHVLGVATKFDVPFRVDAEGSVRLVAIGATPGEEQVGRDIKSLIADMVEGY